MDNQALPRVSVVIPVFNGGRDLVRCVDAINASSYPAHECILVDDASSDGMTRPAAERHGFRVIELDQQGGPAQARNCGAREASGDILFFTDADVLLHEDAIEIAVNALVNDPQLDAVFGSYDDQPDHPSFLSQYRNLLHHWVHQTSNENASTFWSGCGAIRRRVFNNKSGFSPVFHRPSIEDIELGTRLYLAGHRIRLEKTILCKHMKNWKFWNMLKTDIFSRGVPWMVLMLRARRLPSDLNLGLKSRLAVILASLIGLSFMVLPFTGHAVALLPLTAFLIASVISSRIYRWPGEPVGKTFVAVTLAWLAPLVSYLLLPDPLALIPLAFILGLVWTRWAFYRYAAKIRDGAFAFAVVPVQLLFYLGCGLAVPLGIVEYIRGGSGEMVDKNSSTDAK